jgi:acetolactate synthase regulatory subunit
MSPPSDSPPSNSLAEPSRVITACFAVQARAEAGAMPRVLEPFAKRGLVPSQWRSTLAGSARDELHIEIQLEDASHELADTIARCLRQIPDVEMVLTSEKRVAPQA